MMAFILVPDSSWAAAASLAFASTENENCPTSGTAKTSPSPVTEIVAGMTSRCFIFSKLSDAYEPSANNSINTVRAPSIRIGVFENNEFIIVIRILLEHF